MAKSNGKLIANNKRHIMIILFWILTRQAFRWQVQK